MKTEKRYSIKELSALTDFTARNIRFYIQQGIVDKPLGANKGAYYTESHLRQLLTVKKYKEAGVSLERIAQIVHEEESAPGVDYKFRPGRIEVISRIHVAEGVEITVNSERANLIQSEIRQLTKGLLDLLKTIHKDN